MSEDADVLAGLHGIRLAEPGWPELLVALSIGLALAALTGFCLTALANRRHSPRVEAMSRLTAAMALPADERALALAQLKRDLSARDRSRGDRSQKHLPDGKDPRGGGPQLPAQAAPASASAVDPRFYQPGPPPDPAPIEREVRAAIRRMGR